LYNSVPLDTSADVALDISNLVGLSVNQIRGLAGRARDRAGDVPSDDRRGCRGLGLALEGARLGSGVK